MPTPVHRRLRNNFWKNRVLLAAVVLGLVFHLAGRYTQIVDLSGATVALSASADARHQHLASDGLQWHPPALAFSVFLETVCAAHVPPPAAPPRALQVDDSLYNRPPPIA